MSTTENNYKGVGDEMYSGASELGKFYAIIGLVVCSIIFIICLFSGRYFITRKTKYSETVKAKILSSIPTNSPSYSSSPSSQPSQPSQPSQQSSQSSQPVSSCVQYDSTITRDKSTVVIKKYRCELTVSFTLKDKTGVETPYITKVSSDTEIDYSKTPEITLYYDPTNPTDCSISSDDTKVLGWVLIIIGFFVFIGSLIQYYLTQRFKFFAGASGLMGTFNMFRRD